MAVGARGKDPGGVRGEAQPEVESIQNLMGRDLRSVWQVWGRRREKFLSLMYKNHLM